MIGIVVVSHSAALAGAALELARQMVPGDSPRVALAAGTADGGLGTDAARVAAAIDEVASPDGVLLFADLGSAVLSAELGVELRASQVPVEVTSAPLVEGLVAGLVAAASGAALADVARESRVALAAKQEHLGAGQAPDAPQADGGPGEASALIAIRNPDGLHARPAALVAAELAAFDATVRLRNRRSGAVVADAASMSALLMLDGRGGDEVEVTASGPDARAAVARLEALASDGFGEAPPPQAAAVAEVPPQPADGDHTPEASALGISPGVAVGPVVRMRVSSAEAPAGALVPVSERAAAAASVAPAFAAVHASLEARAARLADPRFAEARGVLLATAALAADPALAAAAEQRVRESGVGADRAVWGALDELAARLTGQGGAMAERAADVRDLRDRVIARLRGEPEPGLPDRAEPFVLVVDELAPADAALLGTTACVALVTAAGGPYSHTAILARSLGLPAVVSPRAPELCDGETVLVDGGSGEVVASPSAERVAQASAHAELAPFDGTGRTADGRRVELLANVASAAEAQAASHAEGVGLLRTEFAFLERREAPAFADQLAAYRPLFAAFCGRRVVVRTLDAGSDKPLAFVAGGHEPNPALGVRGYRTARAHPAVLDEQLRAIAAAAAAERAEAWVMAPMVATVAEARDFAAACRPHGFGGVGVMIETPAAALFAAELLAEVDFVSLGTNDLAQYTLAADRELAALAELTDAWQPAVLRLIKLVGAAGHAAGKPVSVCGEAAADPALAPVLAGLGATSLSMTPRALDAVADALGRVSFAQCVAAADAAAGAPGPREARAAAAAALA